jgi:hypothetical protein
MYPIPCIDEIFASVAGGRFYKETVIIDFTRGSFQEGDGVTEISLPAHTF